MSDIKYENILLSQSLAEVIPQLVSAAFGHENLSVTPTKREWDAKYKGKNVVVFETAFGIHTCMWRWRRPQKEQGVFTLRSQGKTTELWPILRGHFQHYLYLTLDGSSIADWSIINLDVFRQAVNDNPSFYLNDNNERNNFDGTAFYKFYFKDFGPGIISQSKAMRDDFWAYAERKEV